MLFQHSTLDLAIEISRDISVIKFLSSLLLILAGLSPAIINAAQDWTSTIKDSVTILVKHVDERNSVYIDLPVDATHEKSYYPFLETIQNTIFSAVLNNGLKIDKDGLSSEFSLLTKFRVIGQNLELVFTLLEESSDSVVETDVIELTSDLLPAGWSDRTLQDIAYEVVDKLQRNSFRFHTGVPVILEDFLGGTTESDSFISDLSVAMQGYLREHLMQSTTFHLVTNELAHSKDIRPYRLQGHYQISNGSTIIRMRLLKSDSTAEVSNVSSTFPTSIIPSTLHPLPPNKQVVQTTPDVEKYDTQKVELRIWVNKENTTYEHGDRLIVSLLPTVDLYARVYYVDSKGEVCEIFPRNGDGFLSGRTIRRIGDHHLEMTIDARETWGQESIVAYTSDIPIDDSAVPKMKNSACANNRKSLHRGLKLKSIATLAAEVKILVKTQ